VLSSFFAPTRSARLLNRLDAKISKPRRKAAIRSVVEAMLGVIDKFDFREIMQGPQHVSAFFGITVGSNELDGVDYWRINEAGLIQETTVL
jgi:hypothetical protein